MRGITEKQLATEVKKSKHKKVAGVTDKNNSADVATEISSEDWFAETASEMSIEKGERIVDICVKDLIDMYNE